MNLRQFNSFLIAGCGPLPGRLTRYDQASKYASDIMWDINACYNRSRLNPVEDAMGITLGGLYSFNFAPQSIAIMVHQVLKEIDD
jgi:hypothetical protein